MNVERAQRRWECVLVVVTAETACSRLPPSFSFPTPTCTGVHCARCPIQRCLLPGRVVQEDDDDVVAGPLVSGLVVVWLGGGDCLSFPPTCACARMMRSLSCSGLFYAHLAAAEKRKQYSYTLFSFSSYRYPGMKWDGRGLRMSPDQEPEVDPRRKEEQKPERFPVRLPVIETQTGQIDVLSRLLKDRILLLGQQVDDEVANILVAQLLYLAQEDKEKDITLYINSPGGSVSAGLAIYDAMQFVPCDVATVCFGMAASMGAFLLGAGAKGKRRSLPNARIMIHQPLGGAQGQAADIEIQVGV